MQRAVVLLVLALASVGLSAPPVAADVVKPQVVVAVADTGVNPYHEIYYRPQNTAHPCTWVEGFDDCSIPALDLSIGEYDTYAEAVAADRAVWDSVRLHQWYWIPKTNIIGAVCEGSTSLTTSTGTCILDDNGHGTGTTSSVLTEAPDALLLVHEGNSGAYDLETAPVVPDIQSHSWGPAAPLPLHVTEPLVPGQEGVICNDGAFDDETIFFIAAGNEAPWPTIADCARVNNRVQVVGGSYPGYWDLSSWTVYDFASWYCRPTATPTSLKDMRPSYCGTSFSAPTAAGAAAAALLQIRRSEGYTARSTPDMVSTSVSRDAFITALRTAATYTPQRKFANAPRATSVPLPAQAPYLFWGYGWLDSTVSAAVASCALGGACPAKSPEAQEHNARRRQIRSATYDDAVPPGPQNDAGSGRDAGATRATAVPIQPGRSYDARLEPLLIGGDEEDWFVFDVVGGKSIDVELSGVVGCWGLRSPDDTVLTDGCMGPGSPGGQAGIPTTGDGRYVLTYSYFAPPQDYKLRVAVE